MWKEFRDFAMRGNVVDMAIGIVIGAAFSQIVNSLVKDIIMPPFGWILGGIDFSNMFISLSGESYPTLQAAEAAGAATINFGIFINTTINFLIISFSIFLAIKVMNTIIKKEDKKKAKQVSPEEKVLIEIRDLLKKGQ